MPRDAAPWFLREIQEQEVRCATQTMYLLILVRVASRVIAAEEKGNQGRLTSNTRHGSNNNINKSLVGVLVPSRSLNGSVRRSSDGVARVRVRRRAISLGQWRQGRLRLLK